MSWKDLLGSIAPTVATALGGPLAGAAVSALSTKLLGHPNASQDDIQTLLANPTADQLLKLKQAENDFKAQMAELGVKVEELDASDRNSARDLAKARGIWPQVLISGGIFVGYFGTIALLITGIAKIPPDLHDLLMMLLGALGTGLTMVLTFWFGSTHGSQGKDATIAKVLEGP